MDDATDRAPRAQILNTLVELARKTFDEPELAFDESTAFEDLDEWDSMNHVHMVVAMERAFRVRFALGDLKRVQHVRDLVDVIVRLQGA